jgi:hypothetical protein
LASGIPDLREHQLTIDHSHFGIGFEGEPDEALEMKCPQLVSRDNIRDRQERDDDPAKNVEE